MAEGGTVEMTGNITFHDNSLQVCEGYEGDICKGGPADGKEVKATTQVVQDQQRGANRAFADKRSRQRHRQARNLMDVKKDRMS